MAFTLSPAKPEDIPGIVEIWYLAFESPNMLKAFPDTPAVRDWLAASFLRSMEEKEQESTLMVMVEETEGKRRVGSFTKWVIEEGENDINNWRKRWGSVMGEGMSEVAVGEELFAPMLRQHINVMGGRKHLVLEVLATHPECMRRGLASKMLVWGCETADREGLECYVDASAKGKLVYERFGYTEDLEKKDPKSNSAAMRRPLKTAK